MKKISFESLAESVGSVDAYCMFHERLPEKAMEKFTLSELELVYIKTALQSLKNDGARATCRMAFRKMLEKAECLEEMLSVYSSAIDGSPEEKLAFDKLDSFQNPEKWLEMFKNGKRFYPGSKALRYLKEKIKDLIDF